MPPPALGLSSDIQGGLIEEVGVELDSNLATERRGAGSACEPVNNQALESKSQQSSERTEEHAVPHPGNSGGNRPNLLIPPSLSPSDGEADAASALNENAVQLEEVGTVDKIMFSSRCFVFSQAWPS